MMKKLLVLVGIAMLLCGCGKVETTVEVTENEVIETAIETSEEVVEELSTEIANMYVEAVYEVFGDDIDDSKLTCNDFGVSYDGKTVSWEYLETVAYNSMTNNYFGRN